MAGKSIGHVESNVLPLYMLACYSNNNFIAGFQLTCTIKYTITGIPKGPQHLELIYIYTEMTAVCINIKHKYIHIKQFSYILIFSVFSKKASSNYMMAKATFRKHV